MTVSAYLLGCAGVALLGAYSRAFQSATYYWGKALAPDNHLLPTGMQDSITPRAQTVRNLVSSLLFIAVPVVGVLLFRWYVAVGMLIFTVLASALASGLLPRADGPFFLQRILSSLASRRAKYAASSDDLRVAAIDDLLLKLRALLQIVLGRSGSDDAA